MRGRILETPHPAPCDRALQRWHICAIRGGARAGSSKKRRSSTPLSRLQVFGPRFAESYRNRKFVIRKMNTCNVLDRYCNKLNVLNALNVLHAYFFSCVRLQHSRCPRALRGAAARRRSLVALVDSLGPPWRRLRGSAGERRVGQQQLTSPCAAAARAPLQSRCPALPR